MKSKDIKTFSQTNKCLILCLIFKRFHIFEYDFFQFHHHNPQISYGIYNSTPEEKFRALFFGGNSSQNIHEQWENDLENLKIISKIKMFSHWRMWFGCFGKHR